MGRRLGGWNVFHPPSPPSSRETKEPFLGSAQALECKLDGTGFTVSKGRMLPLKTEPEEAGNSLLRCADAAAVRNKVPFRRYKENI